MTSDIHSRLTDALNRAGSPMTVNQLAQATGLPHREVDTHLWNSPGGFVWQPGHRWALRSAKARTAVAPAPPSVSDSKAGLLSPGPAKNLGAITLSNGLTIKIMRRALDTDAFFTVRSAGSTIELILNSMHEVFADLPTPFEDGPSDGSTYKRLVEVLLASWALYEDSTSGTAAAKRTLEDARLFWGRRAIEMVRE